MTCRGKVLLWLVAAAVLAFDVLYFAHLAPGTVDVQTQMQRAEPPSAFRARSPNALSPEFEAGVRREEERLGAANAIERIVAPDGMKVAVFYRRTPTQYSYIIVTDKARAGYDPIDPHVSAHHLTWAPDSSRLAYVVQPSPMMGSDVVLHEIARKQSSVIARFAKAYAYSPNWSPKGDKLAILVADESHIGDRVHGNLYIVKIPGGGTTQLTRTFDAVSPEWSPSGAELAVGNESAVGEPNSAAGVAIFNADGTRKRTIRLNGRSLGINNNAQIDRVRWRTDRELWVRTSVFNSVQDQEADVSWYKATW